jgi:hypothetical protein
MARPGPSATEQYEVATAGRGTDVLTVVPLGNLYLGVCVRASERAVCVW